MLIQVLSSIGVSLVCTIFFQVYFEKNRRKNDMKQNVSEKDRI